MLIGSFYNVHYFHYNTTWQKAMLALAGACWCMLALAGARWCLLALAGAFWCLLALAGNAAAFCTQSDYKRY